MMVRVYAFEICGDCEDCAGFKFDAEIGLWFRDTSVPDILIAVILDMIGKEEITQGIMQKLDGFNVLNGDEIVGTIGMN